MDMTDMDMGWIDDIAYDVGGWQSGKPLSFNEMSNLVEFCGLPM
jgi:hypothetical protein